MVGKDMYEYLSSLHAEETIKGLQEDYYHELELMNDDS